MSIFHNVISSAFATALALLLATETGFAANPESKMVTRIETVKATMKGGKLIIEVHGMARISAGLGLATTSGRLVRRGQNFEPNKDGLLEYELHFNPPNNYKEDKLNPVKAELTEQSVPSGVKGVRIYAEFNELNGMLPDAAKKEPASKKEPEAQNKKEIPSKKKEPFLNTETAAKNEEAAKPEPKPTPAKKQGVLKTEPTPAATSTPVKKEKKSWNPFHHKPTPSPTPASSLEPKKEEPVVKKETAPKKEPVVKNEATVKTEATPSPSPTPKTESTEKKKKKGSWWNPFHKKSESSPVATPTPSPVVTPTP